MKTDKQVIRVFAAVPEWIFELTQLESPGTCELKSFTLKELERRADGLIVPRDPSRPLTVVEFQFQRDETIYVRTVQEMAAAQLEFGMRAVEGIIIFAYNRLDPKTEPWINCVRSFAFDELFAAFEQRAPEHPLVAVFKPILVDDEALLAKSAVQYYRQIKVSALDEQIKGSLLEVFVSWLNQRFREKSKQEIEAMLIGELPELEETQSGKDLIAIGEKRGEKRGVERGKKEGKTDSILRFLDAKHGTLSKEMRKSISALSTADANRLLAHLPDCETLDDVQVWLERNA
jgi:predicted transposase YdaD